jgi:hypothetical protein
MVFCFKISSVFVCPLVWIPSLASDMSNCCFDTDPGCLLKELKPDIEHGAAFFPEGWRKYLCRCDSCQVCVHAQVLCHLHMFMHSLRDVHEMVAYRAGQSVCPSVRLQDSTWKMLEDLDEIWHGHYVIWVYPKIIVSSFLQSVVPTWWKNEYTRWEQH